MRSATTTQCILRGFAILLVASLVAACHAQGISSTYADLNVPGQWQTGGQFASAKFGSDIYYDAATGAVVQINQQPGMERVGEISKFFIAPKGTSKDAAEVMSEAVFPLPFSYAEKASKDLAKGTKPPKIWEVKGGEGNPLWFYASQLFDGYQMRDNDGSSTVKEEFMPVRVTRAEQRSIAGGDALLFEVESDKPAAEAVLKRFHMPAAYKDQRVRFGWVQYAPGGIGSGQAVLSVGFAAAASSSLTTEEMLAQVATAKLKPL